MVSILITAGPTREYLDDVRFLGNGSSGRMGSALTAAALTKGHTVTLVLGPVAIEPPPGATVVPVVSALEMQAAADRAFDGADVAIAAAAVADWRPAQRLAGKPPRRGDRMTLELVQNPDIVAGLAARKGRRVVVGFALESTAAGMASAIERGRAKLQRKQLDCVVVNLHDTIDRDSGEFVLCTTKREDEVLHRCSKDRAAARIVELAVALWQKGRAS